MFERRYSLAKFSVNLETKTIEIAETFSEALNSVAGVAIPVDVRERYADAVQGYGYIITPDPDSYGAYTSAVIYADSVTTEGQITFHCEETPTEALKVSVMKIKVEG